MAGIISLGVHIPYLRLKREDISKTWSAGSTGGEKAVANYDEDSITMAISAAFNCINNFKGKDIRFKYAMICWSIGTLAFSILLIISNVVPQIIGWIGIIASILIGFGDGLKLIKPKVKYTEIGAISAILFEIIIGGWLLFNFL